MKIKSSEQKNIDYGFLPDRSAPVPSHPFAVTGDFSGIAKNHCCAVTVTNLVLQGFAGPGWKARYHNTEELFRDVHRIVGNGPVFSMKKANRFLRENRLDGQFLKISKDALAPALSAGRPAALLVAASLFDWHWVLAVGIVPDPQAVSPGPRHADQAGTVPSSAAQNTQPRRIRGTAVSSAFSLRIINNWDRNEWKQYVPGQGAKLLAVWEFVPEFHGQNSQKP